MRMTPRDFELQRKPRFGSANPERMHIPYWEWMVRTGHTAFGGGSVLKMEADYAGGADWSFDRFGMSRTLMPDGRLICIGGEHEDWYDANFYIYNDVIVLRPAPGEAGVTESSGNVEIYGYPEELFTQTDFHSATLIDNTIFVIGRVGYAETRRYGQTPIMQLDTATYELRPAIAGGDNPGSIYKHHAWYDAARHAIIVRGGKIASKDESLPNVAVHALHLADMRWTLLIAREKHLTMRIEAVFTPDDYRVPEPACLRPPRIAHTWLLPEESTLLSTSYAIDVGGVRVDFKGGYDTYTLSITGELAPDVLATLVEDILTNLNTFTRGYWEVCKDENRL